MNGGPPRSTRTAHSFPTRRSSDLLAVEAFLIEGVEAGRRGPGQAAPEAPRVSGRESGRLDVARPRGAIVEMVDIARQAEVRIHVELAAYLSPLRSGDAWWFMLFYGVTFGGFVGLSSSLTIYFNEIGRAHV